LKTNNKRIGKEGRSGIILTSQEHIELQQKYWDELATKPPKNKERRDLLDSQLVAKGLRLGAGAGEYISVRSGFVKAYLNGDTELEECVKKIEEIRHQKKQKT
jgi:hypothetical protein